MQQKLRPGHRLGLMGGTFNPVHTGHLRAAEEIAESLGLEQVHFVPAAQPPHKMPEPVIDYWQRLEMLKLAVSDRPGFWASDLESRLSFPSYTANTLRAFKSFWEEDAEIFFLVGLDSFLSIGSWHEYRQLFNLASFVVFDRAGTSAGPDDILNLLRDKVDPAAAWDPGQEAFVGPTMLPVHRRPGCRLEISSTGLRQRLEAGASVRYLVPEAVRLYIEARKLYTSQNRPEEKRAGLKTRGRI